MSPSSSKKEEKGSRVNEAEDARCWTRDMTSHKGTEEEEEDSSHSLKQEYSMVARSALSFSRTQVGRQDFFAYLHVTGSRFNAVLLLVTSAEGFELAMHAHHRPGLRNLLVASGNHGLFGTVAFSISPKFCWNSLKAKS